MYIVTFYSFKGGVGRTMALVNVGVELAQSGRRVLLVDFDLEAPGLETFDLHQPREQTPGVVDYVTRYIATGEAPDVTEYLYDCPGVGREGGQLWVMPAGKQDEMYSQRLQAIDWRQLYFAQNGYLMFEDLKAQWAKYPAPNYVLIDSRTGYTDIGGICTKQLPHAVVVLFFPNEENLRGLTKVVDSIRMEAASPRRKTIQLHFVMSNVPDLDDEDQILANRMTRFQERLGYDRPSATIHHYNSLALLGQAIFTLERPRSRLAQEYKRLASLVTRDNPEDKEGASEFLHNLSRRTFINISATVLEERLDAITKAHPRNPGILYGLARIRERQGRLEEAAALLGQAIEAGEVSPELLLFRAEIQQLRGASAGALEDIRRVLASQGATYFNVSRALQSLQSLNPRELESVAEAPALVSLTPEDQYQVARALAWSRDLLPVEEVILRRTAAALQDKPDQLDRVKSELVLCLIGQRRFRDAMETIGAHRPEPESMDIRNAFNYAMAEWAETKSPPRDLLQRVLDLDKTLPPRNPNYSQCLAIVNWVTGDTEEARHRIIQTRQLLTNHPALVFSAWRYLLVPPHEFQKDLEALMNALDSKEVVPEFMDTKPDSHSEHLA